MPWEDARVFIFLASLSLNTSTVEILDWLLNLINNQPLPVLRLLLYRIPSLSGAYDVLRHSHIRACAKVPATVIHVVEHPRAVQCFVTSERFRGGFPFQIVGCLVRPGIHWFTSVLRVVLWSRMCFSQRSLGFSAYIGSMCGPRLAIAELEGDW